MQHRQVNTYKAYNTERKFSKDTGMRNYLNLRWRKRNTNSILPDVSTYPYFSLSKKWVHLGVTPLVGFLA